MWVKSIGVPFSGDVVIVDNKSPNGSGEKLSKMYYGNPNVHVILNPQNAGFSGGNNVGFRYAKENLKADFIVMLNNDTIIEQSNFEELVVEEYAKSGFAVLGPRVENPGHYFSSNPVAYKELSTFHYILELVKVSFNYILMYLHVESIYQQAKRKAHIFTGVTAKYSKRCDMERRENVMLHGCFWVFSKKYIDLFDGLNQQTFLFCEEPLLYHRLLLNKLKSVYQPAIHIFHKEDAATNSITLSNRKKHMFVNKHQMLANFAVIRNRFVEKPVKQ